MNKKLLIPIFVFFLLVLTANVQATISDDIKVDLVSYYKLDANATDFVSGINGSVSNAVLGTGKINDGYVFDGDDDIVTMSTDWGIQTAQEFTFSAWVKADVLPSISDRLYQVIMGYGESETALVIDKTTDKIYFFIQQPPTTNKFIYSNSAISVDTWYHIASTFDGTNMKLYVNGVLQTDTDSVTSMDARASGDVNSFGSRSSLTDEFDGVIDEIGIWARPLNQTEITFLYNNSEGIQYPFTPSTPPTAYLDLTLIDNETSSAINTFNATINGTFYETDNGTINTNINQSIGYLMNIVFRAENHFDRTYTNYNTSTDLEGVILEYPKITTLKYWLNTSLTNTNATIEATTYSAVANIIYIPLLTNNNVTIQASGYFDYLDELDFVDSTDYTRYLKQSEILFAARTYYSNQSLSNFTILLNGTHLLTTTENNASENPPAGTWNITLNSLSGDFKNISEEYTISALDNKTIYIYSYQYYLTINATDLISGSPINNFTIYVNSSLYDDYRNYSTTTGTIQIPLNSEQYEITIDAQGQELRRINFTLTADESYSFELYTTNSFNFSFYDTSTLQLIDDRNVTIELIGYNKTTTKTDTGSVYIDLLTPDTYTFVFYANGYTQNTYIATLSNRSYNQFDLYLNPENTTTLVLLNVRDKYGTPLSGVEITIQRYLNNSWRTEQIVATDFQGRAEGQFKLSTSYYNFILDYQGVTRFGAPNDDVSKKLIFAEDVSSGLTFTIGILETGILPQHQKTYDLYGNLTYISLSNTTGYFRFYYNDPANTQWKACLEVVKGGDNEVVCSCASTQVTAESAIMTCSVNQSTGVETYYAAAIFEGGSVPWRWVVKVGQSTNIDWGITGYVIAFFLVFTAYFLFSKMPSFAVLISTGVFVLCGIFGLIFRNNLGKLDLGVYTLLIGIAFLIAKIKSDSSGLEGS